MKLNRRATIKSMLTGAAALSVNNLLGAPLSSENKTSTMQLKGNINHAVCRWCYNEIPLETLCAEGKKIGLKAIDLVGPDEWDTLKNYGLHSSMCNGAEINLVDGFNDKKFHTELIKRYSEMIPRVAKAGYTNLICFSGNRRGKTDEEGRQNCVDGLKQLLSLAEQHKVILVMELLNSKVDHKDYQCDNTKWGIELCNRLGSENFKLLYDIYHMQIDEGDVIATIKKHNKYFAHYHTGGVPGRHEIDETQELYYPAIMKAILDTGYKGYVAQEFIPKEKGQLATLKKCVELCDV
ncbi:hydroxypyruvate isomerase family protein [Mucilaginibacter auburnensis]|uniref:Hydroxypyruvate isomerase n=1 Tax=Mucilaginibacter auburnensis TaxID=1457233 RepID=A0A2H9VLX3_9SPHI|nr:TIM barrel protein [Mucilaginibacter auburnensis]PJJ79324.1 hydroxypyruvate isomerase [Mucilaginibacter auburnensis]